MPFFEKFLKNSIQEAMFEFKFLFKLARCSFALVYLMKCFQIKSVYNVNRSIQDETVDARLLEFTVENTRHYFQINLDEAISNEGKPSGRAVFVETVA